MRYLRKKLIRSMKPKHGISEFIEDIKDFFWYDILSTFYKYKEQLERMWFWAWKMRKNYDFDALYIHDVIYLKLERVHESMKRHHHLTWNDNESSNLMRKLCEAKGLAKRVAKFDYETQGFIETDDRFKYTTWFTKSDIHEYSIYNSKWSISPKNANLFLNARQKHYKQMKQDDKKRLYYLLDKYLQYWWD